jgi:RNA polymerase sigma-70 factor (ECF subfamily)
MGKQQINLSDRKTFSEFYEHAHLAVFRYIYSLHGGPREEVEDLTAETFSRAWKARRRFEGNIQAANGWLFKIARNLIIDSARRDNSRGIPLPLEGKQIPAENPLMEETASLNENITILFKLMQELPVQHREMLTLRYILGWRVKDIGLHLDIPENTISVTIKRVLAKLENQWPNSTN